MIKYTAFAILLTFAACHRDVGGAYPAPCPGGNPVVDYPNVPAAAPCGAVDEPCCVPIDPGPLCNDGLVCDSTNTCVAPSVDLSSSPADMSTEIADLSTPDDLTIPADLTVVVDPVPDFSVPVDMTTPADLTVLADLCSPNDPTDGGAYTADMAVVEHDGPCVAEDVGTTTLCHIPPGNTSALHTICVGNPAVPTHLGHGDYLGPCT